jgi:hypothetical protein
MQLRKQSIELAKARRKNKVALARFEKKYEKFKKRMGEK